jgi:hypothetical protein
MLTDSEIRRTQAKDRDFKLFDSGGLFLLLRSRNVQKQSRRWSIFFAMIVAEHSAESLTSFDSSVKFANGAERPQQVVF